MNLRKRYSKEDVLMKKLFNVADEYISNCTWKDISLLKICLLALGLLIGCAVPEKHKKAVTGGAFLVFIATYIPQMVKFLSIISKSLKEK